MNACTFAAIPFLYEKLADGVQRVLDHLNPNLVAWDALTQPGPVSGTVSHYQNGCVSYVYRQIQQIAWKHEPLLALHGIEFEHPPPHLKPLHSLVVADPEERIVSVVSIGNRNGVRFAREAVQSSLPSGAAVFPISMTGMQLTDLYEKYKSKASVTLAEWKYKQAKLKYIGGSRSDLKEIESRLRLDHPNYPVTAFRAQFDPDARPIRALMIEARSPRRENHYVKLSATIKNDPNQPPSEEDMRSLVVSSLRTIVAIVTRQIPYLDSQLGRQSRLDEMTR